jgi:four helix bundle protein
MRDDLKEITMAFTLKMIDLAESMEYSIAKKAVSAQHVRAGSSVGANYRAALQSRSDKEFIAKINIVLEEIDEACFWLEVIKAKQWKIVDVELKEANELTAIFVTILKKVNAKRLTSNL